MEGAGGGARGGRGGRWGVARFVQVLLEPAFFFF